MAAKRTVAQPHPCAGDGSSLPDAKRKAFIQDSRSLHFSRLLSPKNGVIVLSGFGIRIQVDRGHLVIEDGIADERRLGRFPRVHHNLKRIAVIGNDGFISLAAIRWLSDQHISFTMLERDGTMLLQTGPLSASDARLRRLQACSVHSLIAVGITRHIIERKLEGQESLALKIGGSSGSSDLIARYRVKLHQANSIDEIRFIEGQAASIYWSAWKSIEVRFPKSDLKCIPYHWRTFDTRNSLISGTSRRASNPVNAILNFLYTVLESETRIAIAAMGLDPGFGLLHVDQSTRDSLVYDLMEPIRPKVDAYVFDWISHTPLKRNAFFELRDGTVRLLDEMCNTLSSTAMEWFQNVAPIVEWYAQTLSESASTITASTECQFNGDSNSRPYNVTMRSPGTRLTQRNRYEGQGSLPPDINKQKAMKHSGVCASCGTAISHSFTHCYKCAQTESGVRLLAVQASGMKASRLPEVRERKASVMNAHRDAIRNWQPSELPDWLTDEFFTTRVLPVLHRFSKAEIARECGISRDYVYQIINGRRVPHRRLWLKLSKIVGASISSHE